MKNNGVRAVDCGGTCEVLTTAHEKDIYDPAGKYVSGKDGTSDPRNKCMIEVLLNYPNILLEGQKVYITKLDPKTYNIRFCDLDYGRSSIAACNLDTLVSANFNFTIQE